VQFYSEGVLCHARLFLPARFSADARAAAVVIAPGQTQTAASLERYGAALARHGLVAMAIDYRGWGKSGGFLYIADTVRWDDRLRFSQHTAKVRTRRKRISPEHQLLDIRNAMTWLQGEAGVDRARTGVWGTDLSGGHVITLAANDERVKAGVAQSPVIDGREAPRRALSFTAPQQADMIRLARTGQAPATPAAAAAMNDLEAKLALAEYKPFWHADAVPAATAILFLIGARDAGGVIESDAAAASRLLKGPTSVITIPGALSPFTGADAERAANAAAEWFVKHL
jgi:dienelactone hydrolase